MELVAMRRPRFDRSCCPRKASLRAVRNVEAQEHCRNSPPYKGCCPQRAMLCQIGKHRPDNVRCRCKHCYRGRALSPPGSRARQCLSLDHKDQSCMVSCRPSPWAPRGCRHRPCRSRCHCRALRQGTDCRLAFVRWKSCPLPCRMSTSGKRCCPVDRPGIGWPGICLVAGCNKQSPGIANRTCTAWRTQLRRTGSCHTRWV